MSAQDEDESDSGAAAPPEGVRAKRQRLRAPDTILTLKDKNGHEYFCFDALGVQAVQRMIQNAEATAAEGTRGGEFVFDRNTSTYSLMNVVSGSSSLDTVSLQYLKKGDDHSAPILTKLCIDALRTVPEIDAAIQAGTKIRFAPLLRRDESNVRNDDLAFAKKLAQVVPKGDVADLFHRNEPLTDRAPYNNNSGRIRYHSERKPLVHREVVEENRNALFVIVDYFVDSGGKGAAAKAALLQGSGRGVRRVAAGSALPRRFKIPLEDESVAGGGDHPTRASQSE